MKYFVQNFAISGKRGTNFNSDSDHANLTYNNSDVSNLTEIALSMFYVIKILTSISHNTGPVHKKDSSPDCALPIT